MNKIPKVILLIENSRAYGRGLLRGIAKYSCIHGPWSFYRFGVEMPFQRKPPFSREHGGEKGALLRMKEWGADGIIMRETKNINEIIDLGLPTIVSPHTRKKFSKVANIISNCPAHGKMAAEHLLNQGFKRFAYCGFNDVFWSQERGSGFAARIKEAGYEVHFYKQPRSKAMLYEEKEQPFLVNWLKSLPKPIGLMACIDERSQDVVEACKISGLRIPDDVAVIGVDNDELICQLSNPPLSSVVLNAEDVGYQAAQLLEQLMKGKKKMANQLVNLQPTHVVARQSTNILALEDKQVVEALRFIREHSKELLQVSDVSNAVAVSSTTLTKRFHRTLGRSIFEEIRRVRVNQVAQMLVETNMSISQIAHTMCYPSIDHVARSFKKVKGVTPLAYRKQYLPHT